MNRDLGDRDEAEGDGVKGECEGDPHSRELRLESAGDFRLIREGEVFLRNSLKRIVDKILSSWICESGSFAKEVQCRLFPRSRFEASV